MLPKKLISILITNILSLVLAANAQDSISLIKNFTNHKIADTNTSISSHQSYLNKEVFAKKQKLVTYSQIASYTASSVGLYYFWYKDYPVSQFHFFNDNEEYLQVDKVSHIYGAYLGGKMSMQLWKWAGASKKKYVWLGGTSGLIYETAIEIMDGFSPHWGFSWGDYASNIVGTSLLIGQELAWDEQRIQVKYSTHYQTYSPPELERFAISILGTKKIDRIFKDYNPQTYWFSFNIKSFLKSAKVPNWLNVAFGYGAENIVGARHIGYIYPDGTSINADDILPRYRQWYIAPDIDLTRIKTKSKFLKTAFFILNSFKFPSPSIEFSQGKIKWNWLHF